MQKGHSDASAHAPFEEEWHHQILKNAHDQLWEFKMLFRFAL